MSVELLPYEAADGVELLIAWALPLCTQQGWSVGPARDPSQLLPQIVITDAAPGTPLDDKITELGIYSVHVLVDGADRAAAEVAGRGIARLLHRRILALGPPLAPQQAVTLSGGRTAWADQVLTALKFRPEPYGDAKVFHLIGRYRVDLRLRAAQP